MKDNSFHPTPPPVDTPAGWAATDEIIPLDDAGPIAASYDWLIVGAGITGLSAAQRLAEMAPESSVLLVDARPVGWGSSGRNSGFLLDLPHKFELDSRDKVFLKRIVRLNKTAIADLKRLVTSNDIACDWSEAGKFQGAVGQRGNAQLDAYRDVLELINEDHTILDRRECASVMGTNYYECAVFTPGSVLLDPFRLVRGLARNLGPSVTLRDSVAVVELTRQSPGFTAVLRRRDEDVTIRARRVILGVDPFVSQFGCMTNRIVPAMTFASMTRRLTPAELKRYTGKLDWGLTPADSGGTTLRMTADGRLLIRNQYMYSPNYRADKQTLARVHDIHRKGIDLRFPAMRDVPIASTWAGIVSLSGNHATYFGESEPGLYSANCYNGVGMVRGKLSGKLLVDLALGIKSEDIEDLVAVSSMPSLLPPDPLLGIGVQARMRWVGWQSRTEQ